MALVNTMSILPDSITGSLIIASSFLIAMAMAAMGINVNMASFARVGHHPVFSSYRRVISLYAVQQGNVTGKARIFALEYKFVAF